ncbi:MAG: hypothetical protein K2V38_22850, partial [Gemmataceae bacterium]|nr:hypothetical protein [Gemmataceae bacterium]
MNWFKLFRLSKTRNRPLARVPRVPRADALALETLEAREVPATPTVLGVTPTTGGTLGTALTVRYSIDVTGAGTPGNYRLFAADGTPATIASVQYDNTTFTATIQAANLSVNGGPLTAGTYSLYLRGDQIADAAVPTDRLATAGQIVVSNGGQGRVAAVNLTGSGLGAVQTVGLPAQGTTPYGP